MVSHDQGLGAVRKHIKKAHELIAKTKLFKCYKHISVFNLVKYLLSFL